MSPLIFIWPQLDVPLSTMRFYSITQCSSLGSLWEMPDSNPGTSAPEVWRATNKPPHRANICPRKKNNKNDSTRSALYTVINIPHSLVAYILSRQFCYFAPKVAGQFVLGRRKLIAVPLSNCGTAIQFRQK